MSKQRRISSAKQVDFTKLIDNQSGENLIPAIILDSNNMRVLPLMVGFMNFYALTLTLETGFATFYSRSRRGIWKKGETSGNILHIAKDNYGARIFVDCDFDTICIEVDVIGPACHTGTASCFEKL